MDQSIRRLPDPAPGFRSVERRRTVRQKLHTPVYASFNGPQTGMVVDLSELLDLHEEGFAVQTSERLEANRAVTLYLDLPETNSFIHSAGQVVWSDDTGRGGIRFSGLSESARQTLKQWLFANLLIACSNHVTRTEQLTRRQNEEEKLSEPAAVAKPPDPLPAPDPGELLSSLETVRREVHEIGDDVDAVLQLVTERALSLTGASGAALALLTDGKMVCRARAGEPTPPLGAAVDAKQGLSGECVRNGLLVSCEDTASDPRLDAELCRTLGLGSLMAAPIVSDFRVVGLLEIFSPRSRSFAKVHETVLDRLVEMIPKTHREKHRTESIPPENIQPETPAKAETASAVSEPPASETGSMSLSSTEFGSMHAIRETLREQTPVVREQVSQQVAEPAPAAPSHLLHWTLLGLAILAVTMALGYLVGSMMRKPGAPSPQASQRSAAEIVSTASAQRPTEPSTPKSLAELRMLADRGDADAQWQMGVRYYDGDEVAHDAVQAMKWFELAAEQGHVNAQSRLGAYYWAGRGVPVDLLKAYFWSTIAMHQGDEISRGRLEGLSLQMTRAQVAAASQQADAWLRQHNSAGSRKN